MARRINERRRPPELSLPALFRCPISLEVMRSPVSLCTGVTYDRVSIQQWIDSGHRTCPATALPLPSTDLVPNLTLRRLIECWSSPAPPVADDVLRGLRSSDESLSALRRAAEFVSSDAIEDNDKNRLVASEDFMTALMSRVVDERSDLDVVEAVFEVLWNVVETECIEQGKDRVVAALVADLDSSLSGILRVMKDAKRRERSQLYAIRVLQTMLASSNCDAETKLLIVEKDDLVSQIVEFLVSSAADNSCGAAVEAAVRCLAVFSQLKRSRAVMVRAGAVASLVKVLTLSSISTDTAEKAIVALSAAVSGGEGRSAACEISPEFVAAVMNRMLKVGREGREAAVSALWSAAVASGGDRRVKEAVVTSRRGAAKILVLMQGECTPATAAIAGDLLRIFDSKSCFAGYDTKTMHIMPF